MSWIVFHFFSCKLHPCPAKVRVTTFFLQLWWDRHNGVTIDPAEIKFCSNTACSAAANTTVTTTVTTTATTIIVAAAAWWGRHSLRK
jgi:hypothetical protein